MLYFKLLEDASAVDTRQKDMLRLELDLLHWMLGYTFDLLEDTSWGKCLVCKVSSGHGPIDIRGVTTLLHSTAALLIARWTQGTLIGFTGVFTDHEAFAIRYVIDYIQQYPNEASDLLIAIVSQLASTALLRDDMSSFEGHMSGLSTLVLARGGLQALDCSSELAYIVFRVISRASTISPTLVPPPLRNPYSATQKHPTSNPNKLSFAKLYQQNQITRSLSSICEDILNMDHNGAILPSRPVNTHEKPREYIRTGHQINRILISLSNLRSTEPNAFRHYDHTYPMQEALRLTAKLYVTSIYCREPLTSKHLQKDLTSLRLEIKHLLSSIRYPPTDDIVRPLFFIIYLASALTISTRSSFSSSKSSSPSPSPGGSSHVSTTTTTEPSNSAVLAMRAAVLEDDEKIWITSRMKDMAHILRVGSWLAAESHLRLFFWNDVSCSKLFKGVWDSCMGL